MEIKEHEKKNLLDKEFDGIREFDNNPPPWIMWVLYISIFWAALYLLHYNVLRQGRLQAEDYEAEVAEAKIKYASATKGFDESKINLVTTSAELEEAKKLFTQKTCIACHGQLGEGNSVGPNLTDEYWIHPNTPEGVFKSIKYGYPEKGMTAFKDQLTNEQIQMLTSYVLVKLKGSNPPNAKQPQGEKMK